MKLCLFATAILLNMVSMAVSLKECDPRVPDSPHCEKYEDSCELPERSLLCQRYCGICQEKGKEANNNRRLQTIANCADSSVLCKFRINMCGTSTAVKKLCPKSCGLCSAPPKPANTIREQPTSTATTPRPTTTKETIKRKTTPTLKPSTPTSTPTTQTSTATTRETTIKPAALVQQQLKECDPRIGDSSKCGDKDEDSCAQPHKAIHCQRYCGICSESGPDPKEEVSSSKKPIESSTPATVTGKAAQQVLIQQPKSSSAATDMTSCVDLTNFLCPMLKCMANSEFTKLCERQSVYICDKNR